MFMNSSEFKVQSSKFRVVQTSNSEPETLNYIVGSQPGS